MIWGEIMKWGIYISVLLLFVLVVSAEPIEVVYWTPFSGNDEQPMADLVAEFNDSQSDVVVRMVNHVWVDYYPKLESYLQNGTTGPDIAVVHTSKLAALVDHLRDIAPYAEEASVDWSSYAASVIRPTQFGPRQHAIPLDTHALVMYYNKKLLRDMKLLSEDEEPLIEPGEMGFLDFLETIKSHIEEDPSLDDEVVYPFVTATDNVFVFWSWYSLYSQITGGGSYIKDGKAAFNNIQAREAAHLLLKLRDQDLWKREIGDLQSYDEFLNGQAVIAFTGVWATWLFEQSSDLEFGVLPIPTLYDKPATWGDSHTLVLPLKETDEDHILASIRFADWLASNGQGWAVAGHVPVKPEIITSEAYQGMSHRSQYAEIIQDVNFYPQHPQLWACNEIMVDCFVKMVEGEFSVDQAIEMAESQINQLLAGN